MRKLPLSLLLLLFISFTGKAQITADGTYQTVGPIWRAHFSYYGHKFINIPANSSQINLLNTDMTLWKTINVSIPPYTGLSLAHISDKLIDTDTLIELVVSVNGVANSFIINENNDILYDFGGGPVLNIPPPEIVWIDGQYKMIAQIPTGTNYVFNVHVLPMQGYLPCEDCVADTTGVDTTVGNKVSNLGQTGTILVTDPVPNPSNGTVSIGYYLPKGAKSGELVFYNTNGQEVKRVTVKSDNTKNRNRQQRLGNRYLLLLYV